MKKVLEASLSVYKTYADATQGGRKLTWKDVLLLGPVAYQIAGAANSFAQVGDEWEKATDENRKDLVKMVREGFAIEDAAKEAKIEAAISLAIKLGALVEDFKVLIGKGEVAAAPAVEAAQPAQIPGANPQV